MTRRIDAGSVVAAAGAVLLWISLFLDWYGDEGEGYSAWTLFEVIDLLLAVIALLALSTLLARSGVQTQLPEVPLLILGGAAVILTASQLIDGPPAVALSDFELQTGAWLGLAGAALLLAGAFMSVARVSFSVEQREPPPRPAGSEPETVKMRPPDEPV